MLTGLNLAKYSSVLTGERSESNGILAYLKSNEHLEDANFSLTAKLKFRILGEISKRCTQIESSSGGWLIRAK
jgi:hypothetical protein